MADERNERNAGTMTDKENLGQKTPSRNPNDDQLAGQRGGQGQGKDQGLGKGPMQGDTGRDEGGFEKRTGDREEQNR